MNPDLAQLYRAESGRILSALMMLTSDITLAEDALQDAFVQASTQWTRNGLPKNRSGWLFTVARRRLIDKLRQVNHREAESTLQAVSDQFCQPESLGSVEDEFPDERLRLIFTCSHPALADNVRVPLTLKTLCGLSVREIARAFLCSEHAMEQRITRAKRKIRQARIAYEVPAGDALTERLDAVLSVIYLLYNESYSAYEGQTLTRADLANEAIRLARLLTSHLPNPEVDGLLALLLLHDSRRQSRTNTQQCYIPLEQQDRTLWDQVLIKEGVATALSSLANGQPGPYRIQAAISACHALSPNWAETDWHQIQELYKVLFNIQPSPVVRLNMAMATAYSGNVDAALAELTKLEAHLPNYQPFYAARAELHFLAQKRELARTDYEHAIALSKNQAEIHFLMAKLNSLPIK